jgi:diguanylate cyclase (GGDEF)-like protein
MRKPLILVVDDDPSILNLIQVNLRVSGYEVATAGTLAEAGRKVAETNPNLIILDVNLPDGDGFDFLTALKTRRSTENLPVLILTAMDERRGKLAGFDLGADDYITKPFDVTELELRIRAILRRASRERTLNPLTGLPGNSLIEEELTRRIENGRIRKYAVFYLDIDGFDDLSESQGFIAGDQLVLLLGDVIGDAVRKQGGIDDFIGHVGGDDFVVVTTASTAEGLAKSIIDQFKIRVGEFPALSIGIVTNEGSEYRTASEIGEVGTKARRLAKEQKNSAFVIDRGVI